MKYTIPIIRRKELEIIASKDLDFCTKTIGADPIVLFSDNEPSGFYFKIEKLSESPFIPYVISYTPTNRIQLTVTKTSVNFIDLNKLYEDWIEIVKEYHTPSILFDDPITQKYFDELEPEFVILDEDKDSAPYSIQQQKGIVLFLEKAKSIILNSDIIEAEDTIELIDETIKTISQSTKKKVIERVRKIIAKGFKMGLEVGEKLLIEFTTELAKKLITGTP